MRIAIASGKGGTGKTMVSTNLFQVARNEGIPVSLVDCDAEEPNVTEFIKGDVFASHMVSQNIPVIDPQKCVFCGKCFEYCNYHAIIYLPPAQFIQVVEELCHDCGACSVACEFNAITENVKQIGLVQSMHIDSRSDIVESCALVGVYSPVPAIKKAIKEADNKPLVIFDSPPGISCPFIASVITADFVILVTEPTPFGLNDLKLSLETLQHLGKPFGVIVNRADIGNKEVYDWLQFNNIPLLMEIPFDREIARIYSEGHLFVEEMPVYQAMFLKLLKTILTKI